MNITALSEVLGIKSYPQDFEHFCKKAVPVSICDISVIERLENEYSLLSEYTTPLLSCLEMVQKDYRLTTWGGYAAAYMRDSTIEAGRQIRLPIFEEDSVMRFYPLLVLCATLPSGIEKFRSRGFSEEEIHNMLANTFKTRIAIAERDNGKQGLDNAAFNWLRLYAIAGVFPCGVFNVTPKFFSHNALILKNKVTGELVPLMTNGVYHKSGMALGSDGYIENNGSFTAEFTETNDSYIGNPAIKSLVSEKKYLYKKSDWEVLLKKGDGFAGIHIPHGADLSPDKIKESFRLALKITRERYPEYDAKAIACVSWMLDPKLEELLGEKSKITGFIRCFEKYPIKSGGHNIFGFVFPRNYNSYESLPEDTSLRRKLKKLYLDGGYIYSFAGIVKEL